MKKPDLPNRQINIIITSSYISMEKLIEGFTRLRLNRLARKMQKGDAKAAEEIYNYFANKLFGFLITRVRNKATAEDLAQDIFLKLVGKINLFDPKIGNFSSWFWQLARNTLIDYYRSAENKKMIFSDLAEETIENFSVDESNLLESRVELNEVFEFLKTLSAEEQEVFELRFVAQLSFREISKITGRTEGALRVFSLRLKKKIKDNLKR